MAQYLVNLRHYNRIMAQREYYRRAKEAKENPMQRVVATSATGTLSVPSMIECQETLARSREALARATEVMEAQSAIIERMATAANQVRSIIDGASPR